MRFFWAKNTQNKNTKNKTLRTINKINTQKSENRTLGVCVQRQKVCKCAYFVFALVTATERALHGVAALHSDLSPHHDSGGRLFGAFHNKTAAAHAEGRGDLGQDFRKSLGKTQEGGLEKPEWYRVK